MVEGKPMRCSCGRPRPLQPVIIGLQRGLNDEPALALWNCVCGSTRAIRWADATEAERQQAYLAEMSRQTCEMQGWGG